MNELGGYPKPSLRERVMALFDRNHPFSSTDFMTTTERGGMVIRTNVFKRGGERVKLMQPNGAEESYQARDIIHLLERGGKLLGRFRAADPRLGFSKIS